MTQVLLYFLLVIPDEKLCLVIYCHHGTNVNYTSSLCLVVIIAEYLVIGQ